MDAQNLSEAWLPFSSLLKTQLYKKKSEIGGFTMAFFGFQSLKYFLPNLISNVEFSQPGPWVGGPRPDTNSDNTNVLLSSLDPA
jgi:hypothetical protein